MKDVVTLHELAENLSFLARLLKSMPDGPADKQLIARRPIEDFKAKAATREPSSLVALVAFSKFSKSDWVDFIQELDLPIHITSSHSARDLMGKIVGYFADNPEGRERLQSITKRSNRAGTSQSLLDAFNAILKTTT